MVKLIKKIVTLFLCLFFPIRISYFILNLLGHEVRKTSRVGFSIIWVDKLILFQNSRILHFNIVIIPVLTLSENAYISYFNQIWGPIELLLKDLAAIGNFNIIKRPRLGISVGKAKLEMGILSKITAYHYIDCCQSVMIGDYSTLAGIRSQIWTHGYVHSNFGESRFRVDGNVYIGNNVYIGSMCVINSGVRISSGITIGSGANVSKSLHLKGLYVSQPLRYIERNYEDIKANLIKNTAETCVDEVYFKNNHFTEDFGKY